MWPGYLVEILAALSGLFSTASAQTWTPITPSDTAALPAFRALRFDVAGTVKIDAVGTSGAVTAQTYNVAAGEVWSTSSAAITRIYAAGTTASGIVALG